MRMERKRREGEKEKCRRSRGKERLGKLEGCGIEKKCNNGDNNSSSKNNSNSSNRRSSNSSSNILV